MKRFYAILCLVALLVGTTAAQPAQANGPIANAVKGVLNVAGHPFQVVNGNFHHGFQTLGTFGTCPSGYAYVPQTNGYALALASQCQTVYPTVQAVQYQQPQFQQVYQPQFVQSQAYPSVAIVPQYQTVLLQAYQPQLFLSAPSYGCSVGYGSRFGGGGYGGGGFGCH